MGVHLCLWGWGGAWETSSHSSFILPRCDVPLILIFSSQMRAIRSITMHFSSSLLNISFLWYLPLKPSQVYTLLTFMHFQEQRNISVNLSLQKQTDQLFPGNYGWRVFFLEILKHLTWMLQWERDVFMCYVTVRKLPAPLRKPGVLPVWV